MKKIPSLTRLFLNRFIPALFVYLCSMLFLYYVDVHAHKSCLAEIGVQTSPSLLNHLSQHLLGSLAPVAVFLFLVTFAVCLLVSITRRRLLVSHDERQQSLDEIQLLLDSTQEGIYGADHEGVCTLANKSCATLLGYDSPNELLGKSMHELMHHTRADGRPYPADECLIHSMSKTGVVGVLENELFWRKDGSSFPVSFNVLPMLDGNQAIGMVCTFTDITEKLQVEEQLRQAQKMEAVGQLSGGIAHDFNNILQIVSNNTRFAMDRCDKPELHSILGEMLKAVERGANLTRSMLAFSSKQFMRIRPLELNELLSDALVLGQKLLTEPMHLEFIPSPEPLNVAVDRTLMQQVLFNLITNARDAMPGLGTIIISTSLATPDQELLALHRSPHQGMFARLAVKDHGCGIPEDIRKNIFEPFFTTKEVGQGTGLGLSMVFGTVQQHGGFVTVDSSLETGTTFAVYLRIRTE